MLCITAENESGNKESLVWAATLRDRLFGFHAHRGFQGILALVPCKSIHTYGMKDMIDVAFVDKQSLVVAAYRCVSPKTVLRHPCAAFVLERLSKADPWFKAGQRISIQETSLERKRENNV